MKKLIVTCECGQRMQVPRSAIGRTGMCPTCGRTMVITGDNSTPASASQRGRFFSAKTSWWRGGATATASPTEDAKRKFGEAVDLFYARRYAEALSIFDDLLRRYPTNPDIDAGRRECLAAMRKPHQPLALENRSSSKPVEGNLDEDTVVRVILDKMLHGGTESVQLQAAELACRLLGLFDKRSNDSAKDRDAPATSAVENATETERGNGHAKDHEHEYADDLESSESDAGDVTENAQQQDFTSSL